MRNSLANKGSYLAFMQNLKKNRDTAWLCFTEKLLILRCYFYLFPVSQIHLWISAFSLRLPPATAVEVELLSIPSFTFLFFFSESSFFVPSSNILLKDSDSQLSLLNPSNKSMGVGIYAAWMKNVSLDQSSGPEIKRYVTLLNPNTWNYERLNMKMYPGKYKNTTETHSLCSNYSKPPPLQCMSPHGKELVENWKLP